MNATRKTLSTRAWIFGFLKLLGERVPTGHPARRHTLSFRTVNGCEELVLSVADDDDNWLVFLDDADCAKPVDRAVADVLAFLRRKQFRTAVGAVAGRNLSAWPNRTRTMRSLNIETEIRLERVGGRLIGVMGHAELELIEQTGKGQPPKLVLRPSKARESKPAAA